MTARAFTLEHHGERPLTVNRLVNMHRQQWAKRTRAERVAWALLAEHHDVPAMQRADIVATPLHRDRRSPQDPAACAPAVKAAIDGLVDAGVLPDDTGDHVASVLFTPPDVCGRDGLRLTIREHPVDPYTDTLSLTAVRLGDTLRDRGCTTASVDHQGGDVVIRLSGTDARELRAQLKAGRP